MSARSSQRRDWRWDRTPWDSADWRAGLAEASSDESNQGGSDRGGSDRGGSDRGGSDWGGPAWAGRRDVERRTTERRQGPVRIGDAERDQAVALLSDHFVAGRLTQAEFEERSEEATKARYVDDLAPLFDDLPNTSELQVAQGPWSPQTARVRRRPPVFVMLAPFLMIGLVITAVTLTAPWLLWGLFWIMLISGGAHRRRWHHQNR